MKWFKNLRIKPKLITSFTVVIVFSIIMAAVAIITVNNLDEGYTYLLEYPEERLGYLMQINTDVAVMRRCTAAISANAANPEAINNYWQQFIQAHNDVIDNANKYIENNNNDTVRDASTLAANNDIMDGMKTQLDAYYAKAEQGVEIARTTGDGIKTTAFFMEAAPIMTGIADTISELVPKASAYIGEISNANTVQKNGAVRTLIILIVFIVVISVLVALYVAGLISKPMVVLTAFMKKAGETGDISLRPEDVQNISALAQMKDEIGQCIASTASFVQHMGNVSDKLGNVSDGDLTAELKLLSPDDVMGVSLNKMTTSLNDMFGELKTASGQVSAGAGQVSQAAQSLASGSTQQAASIQQFTATLAQMQDKTKLNAENSEKARTANNKAGDRLKESIGSMNEMLDAMKAINESSDSITKVIKVIDDIAFQTNILALNAAVEAARAGQHGKGFAVVAEEVRNLASKSADAAKETAALIEGSNERVKQGNQIVAKTNADLEAAAEDSRESTRLIEQVASASVEQAEAISEINQGIDQISTVVQANSATAEESAAAAEEMSAQAVAMNDIVGQFKLKGGGGISARTLKQAEALPYEDPADFSLLGSKY